MRVAEDVESQLVQLSVLSEQSRNSRRPSGSAVGQGSNNTCALLSGSGKKLKAPGGGAGPSDRSDS